MEIINGFLEILKYTLPALIVFLTAYYVLKAHFKSQTTERVIELKMKRDKEIVMLRLQAYERLALFLERINPFGLVGRVREPEMDAKGLQYEMVKTIREEYEHNLSQQVYVSSDAWNLITSAKDEIIKTVNMLAQQLPEGASAGQFINHVFSAMGNVKGPLPTETALEYLKAECRELF